MRDKKVIELNGGPGDGQLFNVPHFFYYFTYRHRKEEASYRKSDEKPGNALVDEIFNHYPEGAED